MSGRRIAPVLVLAAALAAGGGATVTLAQNPPEEGCVSTQGGLASPSGASPFVRADVRAIADQVTCYCGCPHLQVSKCYCGTADAIRADFARRLDGGQTAEAVIAAYVAEHGPGIMAVPPKRGFHWIVWIGPPLLLIFGAIGVGIVGRRWARAGSSPELAAASLTPEQEAEYRERLRRAMKES